MSILFVFLFSSCLVMIGTKKKEKLKGFRSRFGETRQLVHSVIIWSHVSEQLVNKSPVF